MRWLFGFVLLLLALGTLRTVGCGEASPCGDCNDGDPCTIDECSSRRVGEPPGMCQPDERPVEFYCSHRDQPDGTPCGSGNVCVSGVCRENLCRGVSCDDGNPCTRDDCRYSDGRCMHEDLHDEPCPHESGRGICVEGVCGENLCVDVVCDDGDLCTDDSCEYHTGCVFTEKRCEDQDCARPETYYCDPDTGVVECTWDTDLYQGTQCCFERSYLGCERYGWCIDGGCVVGNGYPRDCTERDDATPCSVGNVIGLCWKGACAVLDCDDSVQDEVCWSSAGATSRCSGHQCYYAWRCPSENHGAADGCHCGCNVVDPDCADGTVGSCDICDAPGSCSRYFGYSGCPGAIKPAENSRCVRGGTGGTDGSGGAAGG